MRVGDVVQVRCDEMVPADLVLVHVSGPSRQCYMSSMNLDGETSLKVRRALDVALLARRRSDYATFESDDSGVAGGLHLHSMSITCDEPNNNLTSFDGYFEAAGTGDQPVTPLGSREAEILAVEKDNVLLRGCVLRNTESVVGVVVYTGHETKMMLNSTGQQVKRSQLERTMNTHVLGLVGLLLVCCLTAAAGAGYWLGQAGHREANYYAPAPSDPAPAYQAFLSFWQFIIVFQVMIPIALYISMELVKLGQAYFVSYDLALYDADTDSAAVCRALNLAEDLGQVSQIFSDKTGTLTQNQMRFTQGFTARLQTFQAGQIATADPDLEAALWVMALCNTVLPLVAEDGTITYQGESPDEVALVAGAASLGWALQARTGDQLDLLVLGKRRQARVLHVLPFDSERRSMSVIVALPPVSYRSNQPQQHQQEAETILLLTKGADSVMLDRCREVSLSEGKAVVDLINTYAGQGLRTLCLARRVLSMDEYRSWDRRYHEAMMSIGSKQAALNTLAQALETNLDFVGCTAVEDRLAEGVPETITLLQRAHMTVWMLTGDKRETAVSVGRAAGLVPQDGRLLNLHNLNSSDEFQTALRVLLREWQRLPELSANGSIRGLATTLSPARTLSTGSMIPLLLPSDTAELPVEPSLRADVAEDTDASHGQVLVVDGHTLEYALAEEALGSFLWLAFACDAVLCCRASPLQKAKLVAAVKERCPGLVTLAIGDGANDVSMIKTAHVGVGINGREGRQAALNSDYSIGAFRLLAPLLLVHGHWCYSRLAQMVLYFFYKNAVFVMLLYWFQPFCGFSARTLFNDVYLILFSLFFTAVPTLVVGILDQDLDRGALVANPALYVYGAQGGLYTHRRFIWLLVDTLWQSLSLYFVPVLAYRGTAIGLFELGAVMYTAAILVVNLHLSLEVQHWNWVIATSIFGSVAVYFVASPVYALVVTVPDYHVFLHAFGGATFWLTVLLTVLVSLLPRFTALAVHQSFFPSDITAERCKKGSRTVRRPARAAELQPAGPPRYAQKAIRLHQKDFVRCIDC